jgi:CheY-like chemotaxis protein
MSTNDIRILMVDDDAEDRQLLQDSFEEIGYAHSIHYEENGEKALEYLHQCVANGELPELVILDLNMPRLNGRQTLQSIKEHPALKNMKVVIYSTSLNPKERDECISLGAHSYVVKPNTYKESLEIARNFYELCCSIRG